MMLNIVSWLAVNTYGRSINLPLQAFQKVLSPVYPLTFSLSLENLISYNCCQASYGRRLKPCDPWFNHSSTVTFSFGFVSETQAPAAGGV